MENIFTQIGIILGVAAIGGVIAQFLRQPLIVAFIAVGILLGPSVLDLVTSDSEIDLFARLGIALLLFVVGLKLDLHVIRTVGPVALLTGLGQVIFTSVIGYLIALMLGMSNTAAIYVAVALTFSSTIIIVKLLSDKREVDSLHGRIAIGFLIVQDIVVVLVMISLTALGQAGEEINIGREALLIIGKGIVMLLVVALLMRYILPALLRRIAHLPELLILFAIALAILGASAGDALGFSKEVGAFLAGIAIASTPYREMVSARLVSLRDFLLLFFFIDLGANLDLSAVGEQFGSAIIFSLFVLIGNPLIVMVIMGYMGYRKRTSFLAGLTVAQISEFSLILAALGLSLGHLDKQTVGLITLVGLITISASTYMILYSHQLYEKLSVYLNIFERKVPHNEMSNLPESNEKIDILLFGMGRFGAALAANLHERGSKLMKVDFDPSIVEQYSADKMTYYGDVEDPEFIASLPLERVSCVVCSVRDRTINKTLVQTLQQQGYRGKIAVACANQNDAKILQDQGADMVIIPYIDAAKEAANRLLLQSSAIPSGEA